LFRLLYFSSLESPKRNDLKAFFSYFSAVE
jgi:hypothetical protein